MSKFIFFEFRCDCGTKFSDLVKPDVMTAQCPDCGFTARRILSAPTIDPRLGADPDFPTMADQWAKVRYQQKRIEDKKARSLGPEE